MFFLFRCRSMTCSQIELKNIPKAPSEPRLVIPVRSAEAMASRNDGAKSKPFNLLFFTIWILNGICASISSWARSLACLCLYLSLVGWLVGLVGDRWLGFLLVWVLNLLEVGLLGFNLLEMCCIFGLISFFGVLGFDDFAGFEKMVPLRFMILFLSWIFWVFCVVFSYEIFWIC